MRSIRRWFQDRNHPPTPADRSAHRTTRADVETLLANFADYVNPDGEWDPWFTLDEINQQFAWDDLDFEALTNWLTDLYAEGKVEYMRDDTARGGQVWRWLS